MDTIYVATILILLVFIASLISVKFAFTVAIIEIFFGILAGNFLHIPPQPWLDFLAGFGGILLTFLAGAEVDPKFIKEKFKESCLVGGFSFFVPYMAAIGYCFYIAGWTWKASLIAGCALSATSLAVVYAVLVESGLTDTFLGKLLMASTFVTNMGTALALSVTFAKWTSATFIFIAASIVIIILASRYLPMIFVRYGGKVIEPEIKLLFFILFVFMALGKWGASHAILPVFVLGLSLASMFQEHRELQRKLRIVAFAMITPFFFIKGGMNVSLSELVNNWQVFAVLFLVKTGAKFAGVWPFSRCYANNHARYITLLMSTGLTFGIISSMYGYQAGHITSSQFSILVAVVIATDIIPTFIAQRCFSPALPELVKEEVLAREEESL